jgi:hypothetical protein
MKRLWSKMFGGLFITALAGSPVWASGPPEIGTVNYIEGQVAIGAQTLNESSVGTVKLAAGQSLSTQSGRAEILLTPGVFLRVDDHSSVQMVSPGLADTIVVLNKGRAIVEVAEIRPENNIRVGEGNSSTQLLKPGLYGFDADRNLMLVFDGKAVAQIAGHQAEIKGGHQLNLNAGGKMKPEKFDKSAAIDDFYRWASLRSSYMSEANVDAARRYAGGTGWSPAAWYGAGWYWAPGFDAYTFIPGDGIFYDPFGWGFYSPWLAFGAPYFGYGYGYGGYYHHHFGPGYHPHYNPSGRSAAFVGHAHSVGGGSVGGLNRGGGFAGRGFSGGSFHGGGGGFHGGGGRGR